jgi:hypothetical protein
MKKEQASSQLFEAFRRDHAVLGRGFWELSKSLRSADVKRAQAIARQLDQDAGAHVAFEEEDFYPRLKPLLGEEEVQRMYAEHRLGLDVLGGLLGLPEGADLAKDERLRLLEQSETMEQHIAECGELFGAMGRIPPDAQTDLYRRLLDWRERCPRWRRYAAGASSPAAISDPDA